MTTPKQRQAERKKLRSELYAAQAALAARQETLEARYTGFQLQSITVPMVAASAALALAHARLASALISGSTIGRATTLTVLRATWRRAVAVALSTAPAGIALWREVSSQAFGDRTEGAVDSFLQRMAAAEQMGQAVQRGQGQSPTYMYRFPHVEPDDDPELDGDLDDEITGDDEDMTRRIGDAFDSQVRDQMEFAIESVARNMEAERDPILRKTKAWMARSADAVRSAGRNITSGSAQVSRIWSGWARVSTTGTPCPWCAMLISRGPVYATKQSAGGPPENFRPGQTEDWRYHRNCACEPRLVMKREYTTAPDLAQTRQLSVLWRDTVGAGTSRGYTGQDLDTDLKKRWDAIGPNDRREQFKRWTIVLAQRERQQARRRAA